MALNVDPAQLVAVAAELARMSRDTGAALPKGWVVPAGADPISAEAVPQLNAHAANLFNGVSDMLNKVQRAAHNVGASAAAYTDEDDRSARTVGGSGGDLLANPVGEVQNFAPREVPTMPSGVAGGSVDPLTFAQQLHAGPGPSMAAGFAESIRKYAGGFHTEAISGIDTASQALQHWTPVGSAASDQLAGYRGWLDQLGTGLGKLAEGIDAYGDAFRAAKAKHPTPQEIIAARKELVSAMRSKNELGIQKALAKFEEQNARSAETIAGYTTDVNSKVTGDGDGESGAESTGNGSGSSESGDSSMLNAMLPALMSAMAGAGGDLASSSADDSDYGLDDYGYDADGFPTDYGSPGGIGSSMGISDIGAPVSDSQTFAGGPMPMVAAANASQASAAGLPRTPVIEPLQSGSAGNSSAARGGAGMPYMPMGPGMGGAGAGNNNDRNRVVAWHPDRLMYVDDTPHTEQVIGERPSIAPTVTPLTPNTGTPNPTPSGGSA
ncbi:PE family protein [Nocardia callitridis]|uniref:PPE family domain-containing protein n=1 Tax=Nocardia callitridis TaxID=648753 RepID=A0ABP9KN15_9NOCA